MASIDSTSDARTVNNTMRHQYRVLTEAEKLEMQTVKDMGLSFHDYIDSLGKSREVSVAKTKVEEAVMWAVKHITAALIVCLIVAALAPRALAANILADPGVVSAAPFIDFLKPYIDILVPPIITALIGYAAMKFHQMTNINIDQANVDLIERTAATQAGKLVAAAEDNLAGKTFTTTSPQVIAAANEVSALLPAIAGLGGMSPDKLRTIVVGEIGKLQANQTPAAAK